MSTATQTATPACSGISDQRRWTIVALLSLGMIIAYVDRANLSAALSERDVMRFFGLNDQDRGTLLSAFFWSYALLQIPAGYVVDKLGVKYPYAVCFLFWSLISAACGMVSGFGQLIILRVLLGVGEAVVTPASLRWIRFNVPETHRGLAVGVYMAGTKIGSAVGVPIAAWLIGGYGWQNMFFILGIGCLVWLLPWMLLVRNDDRELEKAMIRASAAPPIPFSTVMASPAMWGIIIGTFCYNYFVYFCMTWLPAYLRDGRNLSRDSMSLITGASFAGMALVAAVAGWAADRIIARGADAIKVRTAFTIAGFLVASTEIFGALSDSTEVATAFAIISLSGLGLTTANYWALTQSLMPGAAIGRISGVQNTASNLAGAVAPMISGWLVQVTGNYVAPMQFIWVILITGVTSYIVLVKPKYAPRKGAV